MSSKILHLYFDNNSGTSDLTSHIPEGTVLTIDKVSVQWSSSADSLTAGSVILLDTDLFDSNQVNSNRESLRSTLPLLNDTSLVASSYYPKTDLTVRARIPNSIRHRITDVSGNLIANLVSVNIIFSYI